MQRHHRWHGILGIIVGVLWSTSYEARAQWAVYDAANHNTNLVTSFQSTISAVQAVLQTGYAVLELQSLGGDPLGGSFGADIAELEGIIRDTQSILWDIQTIRDQTARIFGLQTSVDSTAALQVRMAEIRRIRAEMLCKARDIQTLPLRVLGVIQRIHALWNRIMGVVGGKQSGQQLQAMLQQLTHVEAQSQTMLGAYHQAILTDASERPVVEESLQRINTQLMADWPK